MEISSDKNKILVNSIKRRSPLVCVDEWTGVRRSGPVKILVITQMNDETSLREAEIRLARTHSVITSLQYYGTRSSPQWLDDHTYRTRSAFTHLGFWRKLYDCSLHHFTTRQCILKCIIFTFSSTSNQPVG